MEPSPKRLRRCVSLFLLFAMGGLVAGLMVASGGQRLSAAEAPADNGPGEQALQTPADTLSYNEHFRSILVENCFGCHGADSAGRKADLRLDQRDAAVESGAIVPGDPDSSVMLDRIFSDDP